jgi:hypothetical protein
MGMKALWIVFGAAVGYIAGLVLAPIAVVVLRNSGVEISDETATNVTRLAALLALALGGAIGLRHAQKVGPSR